MNRRQDSKRLTSLYEQLVAKGKKNGDLPDDFTDEQANALFDKLRAEGELEGQIHKFIGDDLSQSDLEDLWAYIVEGKRDTLMAGWWEDKPHQILYRLLLRLTRVEDDLKASLVREALQTQEGREKLADAMRSQMPYPFGDAPPSFGKDKP